MDTRTVILNGVGPRLKVKSTSNQAKIIVVTDKLTQINLSKDTNIDFAA
jgi:hypothetical protein